MFAGAAREVVFSNPDVVRSIKANFIPVALKAGLVNNPPRGKEGELYREINRTRAAPQGICAMNSSGKVLDWVLSFDSDGEIAQFLSDVSTRYEASPNQKVVATRRFMRYPSHRLDDVKDNGIAVHIPPQHSTDVCPGVPRPPIGTLTGTVIGRVLDKDGKPIDDTWRQEHYMEARLEISRFAQRQFAQAAQETKDGRFDIPDAFVESIVAPAYLGQLDVAPLGHVPGSRNAQRWWTFEAERIEDDKTNCYRLTGKSHAKGYGRNWHHVVTLDWQGFATIRDGQIDSLRLLARGNEQLEWELGNFLLESEPDVAHLMAGHPIDLNANVIYGLTTSVVNSD